MNPVRPLLEVLRADDLAPGDRGVAEGEWADCTVAEVAGAESPEFEAIYGKLFAEFGSKNELETREAIAARFAWRPDVPVGGCRLLYQLAAIRRGAEIVAVRDHTAIALEADPSLIVVHLSHALVEKAWRGTGAVAWVRALPLAAARRLAGALGREAAACTMVAEMEPWDDAQVERVIRLKSYRRAGYKMVDPAIGYLQPDFRPAPEIDRAGGPAPVPLNLVVRRVGREAEETMPASELSSCVEALYKMYGATARPQDMAPLERWRATLPQAGAIRLLSPVFPGG